MTIAGALASRAPRVTTRRERWELPDGDFLDLDWIGEAAHRRAPLVLVLHGLEGSVDSPYARGVLDAIARRGWTGVLMHFRGCSGEPNRLPRGYHSGETEDTRAMVARLAADHPGRPILAVGYSLGGNVLLKYLGEEGAASVVRAAVAVSVPLMLAPCAARLGSGFSRVYDRWLLSSLKKRLLVKMAKVDMGLGLSAGDVRALTKLRAWDEQVTAPLHGFTSAEDYYVRSSSRPFLRRIATPTWIVQAADDPFMTADVLPDASELARAVTLELAGSGGHVGFVAGAGPWAPERWIDRRIVALLGEMTARAG